MVEISEIQINEIMDALFGPFNPKTNYDVWVDPNREAFRDKLRSVLTAFLEERKAEPVAIVHVFESTSCNGRKMGRIEGWDAFVKSMPVGKHPLYAATPAPDMAVTLFDFEPYLSSADFGKERSLRWILEWFYKHHGLPEDKAKNVVQRYAAALSSLGNEQGKPGPQRAERWPGPGDKMRFLNKNGYPFELEAAQKAMTEGQVFTVKKCRVGSFSHSVEFEEITGNWNGVMFELLSAAPQTAEERR